MARRRKKTRRTPREEREPSLAVKGPVPPPAPSSEQTQKEAIWRKRIALVTLGVAAFSLVLQFSEFYSDNLRVRDSLTITTVECEPSYELLFANRGTRGVAITEIMPRVWAGSGSLSEMTPAYGARQGRWIQVPLTTTDEYARNLFEPFVLDAGESRIVRFDHFVDFKKFAFGRNFAEPVPGSSSMKTVFGLNIVVRVTDDALLHWALVPTNDIQLGPDNPEPTFSTVCGGRTLEILGELERPVIYSFDGKRMQ